jgi:hypothetical protein
MRDSFRVSIPEARQRSVISRAADAKIAIIEAGAATKIAAAESATKKTEVQALALRYERDFPSFDDAVVSPGDGAAGDAILRDLANGDLSQDMFNKLWEYYEWDDYIEDYFEDGGYPVPYTGTPEEAAAAAED